MERLAKLVSGAFLALAATAAAHGQFAASPVPTTGIVGETLAERLRNGPGVVLLVTAHPDDEDNATAAMLRWTYGVRVVLWTMTRGEGGQNEIGTEQGEALKLLRDAELEAAHRFDGIEQFRDPARVPDYPDFGYSFSVEETLRKWAPGPAGRGACRTVLQAVKPDVVLTMTPDGDGGGQHHQASARLMLEECALDSNPWRPDGRADDGAEWWRPLKVYSAERSNWTPPGASRPAVRPDESAAPDSRPVEEFDVDFVDPLIGRSYRALAAEARSMHKSQGMSRLLDPIGAKTRRYRLKIDRTDLGDAATRPATGVAPFFAGIPRKAKEGSNEGPPPPAKPTLTTDAAFICPGETLKARDADGRAVDVPVAADAPTDGSFVVPGVEARSAGDVFSGEQRDPVYVVPPWSAAFDYDAIVLDEAKDGERGTSAAFEIRLRRLAQEAGSADVEVISDDERVVAFFPSHSVERLERNRTAVLRGNVRATAGARPQSSLRVVVKDRSGGASAESRPRATFEASNVRTIDYPHVRRRVLVEPTTCRIRIAPLWPLPRLSERAPPSSGGAKPPSVLYVLGEGEESDRFVARFGAEIRTLGRDRSLDDERLDFGRLDSYSIVVIGARAYEFRDDLRPNHGRLMEFVEKGGVVVVQYQKTGAPFDPFAPYPAKIGSKRVTDENGPVEILEPDHPVFTTPNKIGPDDWKGWVKDRSLYHLEPAEGSKERYRDLLKPFDTFGSNRGPHLGALVEARVGRGRWIYCGLALWRQLPEGVPGAWRLWANLLALSGDPPDEK